MILPHTPYVYLIGWSVLNVFYIGSRWAKNCHPSDLFVTYFTSSGRVKKMRTQYGEPDIIMIIKTFTDKHAAADHEFKLQTRMKVWDDERFLNQYKHKGRFERTPANTPGRILTEEHKQKLSVACKGRKYGLAWNKGKSDYLTPEAIQRMSQASKDSWTPERRITASLISTEQNNKRWADPSYRARLAATWTPERKAAHVEKIRAKHKARATSHHLPA